MNIVFKLALTASLAFVAAFTFSCSSGDGGEDTPSCSSTVGNISSSSSSFIGGVSSSSKVGSSSSARSSSSSPNSGTTYESVTIGTQVWMKKNLNIDVERSACYDDDPANCEKYGRLYRLTEALTVCPSGWHLPSHQEWGVLYSNSDGPISMSTNLDSPTAGKHLKATSGWNWYEWEGKSGNGEDTYGFAALPGGYVKYDGNFSSIGDRGYWWSAPESGFGAYYHFMGYTTERASWDTGSSNMYSVRCVKD